MISRHGSLLLLFAAVSLICACGFKTDIPDLSAEELRKMIDGNTGLLVIDTRTQFEYARGHIPRSMFVPEDQFYALKLILPAVKDMPLVFYCRGYG